MKHRGEKMKINNKMETENTEEYKNNFLVAAGS